MNRNANLLSRLYRWASRQDENYTTEAFVYLLNYLIEYEHQIASTVLQKITNGFLNFSNKQQDISDVEIITQSVTDYGRPDIEIKTPNKLIYIEVKVESGLGNKQLDNYRQALQMSGKKDTYLILLSRYAITSDNEQPDYSIRWYEVADWLSYELENREIQPVSKFIIEQFLGYLQDKNMTIMQIKSGISDGIRIHQTQFGDQSILLKRNRNLKNFSIYPELLPLHNLLMMMGEALVNLDINLKPKFDSGQQQGGWVGYNLNNLQYFFVVYLNRPEELTFETFKYKIDPTKNNLELGRIIVADGRSKWENALDLSSPEIIFLSQPRETQIQIIESFVKDCYEFSHLLPSYSAPTKRAATVLKVKILPDLFCLLDIFS